MDNKVLFLGVTNHCASRFAEILFNHIASEQLLSFNSVSRGVMVKHQEEPIDPKTVNALTVRGVPLSGNFRTPETLRQRDIQAAKYVVLISETELAHRVSRSNDLDQKQIFNWSFDNASTLSPSELFPALEAEVYLLVRRLQQRHFQDHISA